jgi:predicted MFS family arabinose efflux permease
VRPSSILPWNSVVLEDRRFLVFLLSSTFIGVLFVQSATVLPVLMGRQGISDAGFGRILAANGALVVLLQPWLTQRLAGLPRVRVLITGSLLVGLGFSGHAMASSSLGHLAAVAVWTVGEIAVLPLGGAMVADFAPIDQRGRFQGAYQMTWSFATCIGPTLAAHLFGNAGVTSWGLTCAGLGALAAIGFGLLSLLRPDVKTIV